MNINIVGLPYEVQYKERLYENGQELFGQIDYGEQTICLSSSYSKAQQTSTLLHETLHGVLDALGEQNDERFVTAISRALYAALEPYLHFPLEEKNA